MRYEDMITLRYQRCFVCRKRVGENAMVIYEGGVIGVVTLPETIHLCSRACDKDLQENTVEIVCNANRKVLDILDLWDDLYDERGPDAPLIDELVEQDYPDLWDYFSDLFHRAGIELETNPHEYGLPNGFDTEDCQGYHEECPSFILAARKLLA